MDYKGLALAGVCSLGMLVFLQITDPKHKYKPMEYEGYELRIEDVQLPFLGSEEIFIQENGRRCFYKVDMQPANSFISKHYTLEERAQIGVKIYNNPHLFYDGDPCYIIPALQK